MACTSTGEVHADLRVCRFPHVQTPEKYLRLGGFDAFRMYRYRASCYAGTKATSLRQLFNNALLCGLSVYDARDQAAEQREDRNCQKNRNKGKSCAEEPEHVFQKTSYQRI